jgi:hypothetical protein
LIITLFFSQEKRQFFRRKLAKIAKINNHNIAPVTPTDFATSLLDRASQRRRLPHGPQQKRNVRLICTLSRVCQSFLGTIYQNGKKHTGVFGHYHAAHLSQICLYLVELPCYALICIYLSAVPFPASVGQ